MTRSLNARLALQQGEAKHGCVDEIAAQCGECKVSSDGGKAILKECQTEIIAGAKINRQHLL